MMLVVPRITRLLFLPVMDFLNYINKSTLKAKQEHLILF